MIRYFTDAELSRARSGVRVPRDFLSIPTYARAEGAYAWAVPAGHVRNAEDRRIRSRAAEVLEEYQRRRRRYIGRGKGGVVELLRDWYDDGQGRCSKENATAGEMHTSSRR